jgi:hypothetical protein
MNCLKYILEELKNKATKTAIKKVQMKKVYQKSIFTYLEKKFTANSIKN